MVMKIEIMESFSDYAGLNTGAARMDSYWIFSSTSNFALAAATLDPTDIALKLVTNAVVFNNTLRMFEAPVTKVTASIGFTLLNLFNSHIDFVDSAGSSQLVLTVNAVGKMILTGEGGAVLATSHMNFDTLTIYRACLRINVLSANNVSVAVSINGYDDPGLTVTADFQDQAEASISGIRLYATGNAAVSVTTMELMHLMVGTGEVVDWGPIEVIDGVPNVDIVQGWDRSTGLINYANIDDTPANGDTDYNYTETVGAKDVFGFTDPEIPDRIVALGIVSWAKKEDSATRRFRTMLRVGGVDYPGADIFSAESYHRTVDAWVTNPATLADWAPTDLAPLQFGYEYLGL